MTTRMSRDARVCVQNGTHAEQQPEHPRAAQYSYIRDGTPDPIGLLRRNPA